MGFRVEAGLFSAKEIGATQNRERIFVLAHRDRDGRVEGERRQEAGRRHPDGQSLQELEDSGHADDAQREVRAGGDLERGDVAREESSSPGGGLVHATGDIRDASGHVGPGALDGSGVAVVADPPRPVGQPFSGGPHEGQKEAVGLGIEPSGENVADPDSACRGSGPRGLQVVEGCGRRGPSDDGAGLDDAGGGARGQEFDDHGATAGEGHAVAGAGLQLADPEGGDGNSGVAERGLHRARAREAEDRGSRCGDVGRTGTVKLADAGDEGLPLPELARSQGRGEGSHGATPEHGCPIWPPYPDDIDEWVGVLAIDPSLEPSLCGMADGMALRVERLQLLGNGVVPVVAALAFATLWHRLFGDAGDGR